MWTADQTYYLTADRETVVTEDDRRAAFLLVRAGGEMLLSEARRYGLIGEAKAVKAAPADKAVKAAPANKSKGA